MIIGIGIDTVEIKRFNSWITLNKKALLRIFTEHELNYAFANSTKTAERLAVRFAAKEAFFKAVSPLVRSRLPFLTVCKAAQVRNGRFPSLDVQWKMINKYLDLTRQDTPACLLSLTHTQETASAVVLLHNS